MQYYDMKEKVAVMQVRLTPALRKDFKMICYKKALNASEVLRRLMEEWVNKHKEDSE